MLIVLLHIGSSYPLHAVKRWVSSLRLDIPWGDELPKRCSSPISKKRNKHIQTVLIEAAKLAPQWNPQLAEAHKKELRKGNRNKATLAIARKLVAYMLAVDKSGQEFQVKESDMAA